MEVIAIAAKAHEIWKAMGIIQIRHADADQLKSAARSILYFSKQELSKPDHPGQPEEQNTTRPSRVC